MNVIFDSMPLRYVHRLGRPSPELSILGLPGGEDLGGTLTRITVINAWPF